MGGRRGKHKSHAEDPSPPSQASSLPTPTSTQGPPRKRQKREEYRNTVQTSEALLPQKKHYRQRAHANPFSDHALTYPVSPEAMDWSGHYPAFVEASDGKQLTKRVEVADIGCGFGGLLFALAPMMPETLILGLEIRTSVTEFVESKIRALRQQQQQQQQQQQHHHLQQNDAPPSTRGGYQNVSVLRANTMKFLPNFFFRAQLRAIFLCFPDPHFKARKHKARIVSATLNAEYAFALRAGGKVYTITDVEELAGWMAGHFDAHASFERVGEEEVEADEVVGVMRRETEEGKKVERNGGSKFVAVWRRVEDPPWPGEEG